MKKDLTLLTILGISILWTGCAQKRCVGPGAYDGLINAVTCDYEQNIKELQTKLNKKTLHRIKLFHEFQRLIAIKTGKTKKLEQLKAEIEQIENDLNPIKDILTKVDDIKYQANPLDIIKLKQRLSSLNMDILNKSTFFSVADASFTNQKLLASTDTTTYAKNNTSAIGDVKYAKNNTTSLSSERYAKNNNSVISGEKYAKNNSSAISNEKYAKAYNQDSLTGEKFAKAYQNDIDTDRQIRLSLSKKIKDISNTINSSNIKESKSALNSLMSDIENYKNSLKKS